MAKELTPQQNDGTAINTDRLIWRKKADDIYSPTISVTQKDMVDIGVGGLHYVKPIEEWHRLAGEANKAQEVYEKMRGACWDLKCRTEDNDYPGCAKNYQDCPLFKRD